jgi:transcriptional regulator with XRE-family HTH domain
MRLKELRTSKNLTQIELAEKIGCNQTAIGKYERKELEPNIQTMIKLCEIFSCSIDYLVGREDDFGIIQSKTELSYREQKLLSAFSQIDDDEKDKIIEDCEYFAKKHTKVKKERA